MKLGNNMIIKSIKDGSLWLIGSNPIKGQYDTGETWKASNVKQVENNEYTLASMTQRTVDSIDHANEYEFVCAVLPLVRWLYDEAETDNYKTREQYALMQKIKTKLTLEEFNLLKAELVEVGHGKV